MTEKSLEKVPTGIEGLDEMLGGGTHPQASILIEGMPGSGKSTMAMQYILAGIDRGEPGIIITLDESPTDIYRDALSFGWDLQMHERNNMLRVVATSAEALIDQVTKDGPLLEAVHELGARRVVVDSISLLTSLATPSDTARTILAALVRGLKREGLRALLIGDSEPEYGNAVGSSFWALYSVDVVIRLATESTTIRSAQRTLEIVKTRTQSAVTGHQSYVIDGRGVTVYPRLKLPSPKGSLGIPQRVNSGVQGLDDMLNGGFLSGRPILVSGPTGSGKTMLALSYLAQAAEHGEKTLLVSSEESPADIVDHAKSIGLDLDKYISAGLLDIDFVNRSETTLGEYVYRLRKRLESAAYARIVLDSLGAVEIMSSNRASIADAVTYLMGLLRNAQVSSLMTYEATSLLGQMQVTNVTASVIADTIILLSLVEIEGDVRKGITVLKHRGSAHVTQVRQLVIDEIGMRVLSGFKGYQGLLTGVPAIVKGTECTTTPDDAGG